MGTKSKKDVGAIVRKSGVSFRVWAPFASEVAVTGSFNDWSSTSLESEQDGYWWVFVPKAQAGQEYKFIIKNGDQILRKNDPRALHYTTLAGNSVITSRQFDWGDTSFVPKPIDQQIIYEMHIGTFDRPDPSMTGTFQTATGKLDHLASLGVTTIELMPVSGMSMEREWWGYTPEFIYAVENLYGGRYQMQEFIKAAHQKGIGVILDVVYNHFGPGDHLDIWQFDGWSENGRGGIYFYNDWRGTTPWGETRPDYGREEVRQYLLDNVRMWMYEFKLDGLRVDSTLYLRNAKGYNDAPGDDLADGWNLLQKINSISRKINPNALMIAEDMGANEYITKSQNDGGAGFNSQWAVTMPQGFRESLISSSPDKINLTRIYSELGRKFNNDAFQRVIYMDSHDTAANGSARLSEVIAPGKADGLFARKQSLIAATILFTTPGIPMLFQGQEFMAGGAFNDWEGLDWEKATHNPGIIEAYRHLIALRKNLHGVSGGLLGQNINLMNVDENNKVIVYHRWNLGGPRDDVVVIANFANRTYPVYRLGFPRNGTWRVRFNSTWEGYSSDFKNAQVSDAVVEAGEGELLLPPSSALILSQD